MKQSRAPDHGAFLATARFSSLDGLRCLSILPVVWHHSTPRPLEGVLGRGPLGVHLFFAISGFLITTLLLRERDKRGAISLRGFYARRSLRIFPLYYAVLILYALRVALLLTPSPMRDHFLHSLPFYATYTGNWFVDYGVSFPVIFGFSWSLATEEQFYLMWPPVLRLFRGLVGPVALMAGLFVVDFSAERGWLSGILGEHSQALWIVTSISAPICLGALLACGLHVPRGFGLLVRILGARASAPITFLVLIALVAVDGAPLLGIHLAMVALVGSVCLRRDHLLSSLLDWAPARWIGTVSYGMYLLHVSVITSVRWMLPASGALLVFLLAAALTVAFASASYVWFEMPFLRLRERFRG